MDLGRNGRGSGRVVVERILGEMTVRFVLLVNKQGQTRLAHYNEIVPKAERRQIEGEMVRKCLTRSDKQCSIVEHRGMKVIYRRYASLFFIVGVDEHENELAVHEFIHCVVETLDRHFGNVCELDIMFHLEKAHYILEEMVMNGQIVETNKSIILGQTVMYDPPPEKGDEWLFAPVAFDHLVLDATRPVDENVAKLLPLVRRPS